MVDITLFELHLDGSEFTANAPGVATSDAEDEDPSDAGGAPLGLVAGLALVVLLVVAAVAVKKLGGSEEDAAFDDE